jgi:hypothetical protein
VDDISTISTIVVTVSVVTGVVFTVLELRHLARTRRTEVIMRVYETFGTKEWIENIMKIGGAKFDTFEEYSKRYGLTEAFRVATVFGGVGVLLQENLIDIRLANSLFGPSVSLMWQALRPVIQGIRETAKQPWLFSQFEYLNQRLSAYRREHPSTAS